MCYTLPKIWQGRVQKYWERVIPADFPISASTFSTKFDSKEVALAVNKLEDEIFTEDSIVKDIVPENTVVSNYIGTYNVEATPGELTLLSPEKVTSDNIVVLHYNKESNTWENVEDIQIKDGYVWGTLQSFSPIAIFEYKRDIVVMESVDGIPSGVSVVVANGNSITVSEDEDGKVTVNGCNKSIEINGETYIVGGTVDGTDVESTNVKVVNVKHSNIVSKVIAGSFFYNEEKAVRVGTVNVSMIDSTIGCLTGSSCAVRTDKVVYNISGSTMQWIGAGESWNDEKRHDVNKSNCSFASLGWAKEVVGNIVDSNIKSILFMSGNTGYFYVDKVDYTVKNTKVGYLITGGSNGGTNKATLLVDGCDVEYFQTTNRGFVNSSASKFINSKIERLFVGGDSTDNTVTGTTKNIRIDINNGISGEYTLLNGVDGGQAITFEKSQEIIEAVKVSRNVKYCIDDSLINILGTKLAIK